MGPSLPPRRSAPPARVVVGEIHPRVDCGTRPAKAVVGEAVPVRARIFADGRPRLRARGRLLPDGLAGGWRAARTFPLAPLVDDWWEGHLIPESLGPWRFRLEAWEDRFGTWCDDVARRLAARVDPGPELGEGWALLRQAARRLPGDQGRSLLRAATTAEGAGLERELAFLLDAELRNLLATLVWLPLTTSPAQPLWVERPRALFGSWYELFARSQGSDGLHPGSLAAVADRLPHLASLGFDVIYLTPIHPVGVTGRRGRNNAPVAGPGDPGSPWAIGSERGGHMDVDPELGTLADFRRLLARAEEVGMEVAMDYALQCSPDHPWVREHPAWFRRRPDGSIRPAENPPKRYDDIYPLDFNCRDWRGLWAACYEILDHWARQGVRIFRVDNPHTKPVPFWEYLVGRLRLEHPEAVLLAEAFTAPAMVRELAKVGFSQSYTYFTWRQTKEELVAYARELAEETADYLRPNFFVNTPDILTAQLQEGGEGAFRSRLLLASTLSSSYGIYSGFEHLERAAQRPGSEEYLDSEKYQYRPRPDHGDPAMEGLISTVNAARREHPALQQFRRLFFHWADHPDLLCYSKTTPALEDRVLVVVNLDPWQTRESMVHLDLDKLGLSSDASFAVRDLLDGAEYRWQGPHNYVRLDPARAPGHLFELLP